MPNSARFGPPPGSLNLSERTNKKGTGRSRRPLELDREFREVLTEPL